MRKSISIATALVVGSGATGAWAALLAPYQGSDTLFNFTRAAIDATRTGGPPPAGIVVPVTDSTIGPNTAYVGGGSGNGQAAMAAGGGAVANATQQTAPMSRMVNSGGSACLFNGGTAGANLVNASGIVVGLDAVDILSNIQSGGQTTAACNGTGGGLAFGGTSGVFGAGTQNWKWILALVYGGKDLSTGGVTDCNSTARRNLVGTWGKLFQGATCAPSGTVQAGSGLSASAVCTGAPQSSQLWHAYRRDEASGTSDVFASILGLSPSTSTTANNSFGTSPYCNAMNWDAQANNANCAFGGHDQWTGPGGIVDPQSTCVISTGVCGAAGTGNHRRPPPGVWGDNPDPSQSTNSADVLPTQMQDNDPIRRPCLGNGSTGVHTRAGDEVCNIDGNLGLVLPMVDTDWITNLPAPNNHQYPTNQCTVLSTLGKAPTVLTCAIRGTGTKHSGECPNGDQLNAAGCAAPTDGPNNTSQCFGFASLHALSVRTTLGNSYGRAYNMFMYDGTTSNPGFMQYPLPAGTPPNTSIDMTGAFNRMHSVETVLADAAPGCQMVDMTDQIGCMTAEDPCSIGYAGDASKSWASRTNGFSGTQTDPAGTWDVNALQVASIAPNATTVQLLGKIGEYQLARKLYFNSLVGFGNVNHVAGTVDTGAADEVALAQNESSAGFNNPILSQFSFFPFGSQTVGGTSGVPFCEDLNEKTICGAAANANGCANNSTVTGVPAAANSTTCGNGTVEAYEECDGTVNAGSGCSATCRCTLDFNNTTGACN